MRVDIPALINPLNYNDERAKSLANRASEEANMAAPIRRESMQLANDSDRFDLDNKKRAALVSIASKTIKQLDSSGITDSNARQQFINQKHAAVQGYLQNTLGIPAQTPWSENQIRALAEGDFEKAAEYHPPIQTSAGYVQFKDGDWRPISIDGQTAMPIGADPSNAANMTIAKENNKIRNVELSDGSSAAAYGGDAVIGGARGFANQQPAQQSSQPPMNEQLPMQQPTQQSSPLSMQQPSMTEQPSINEQLSMRGQSTADKERAKASATLSTKEQEQSQKIRFERTKQLNDVRQSARLLDELQGLVGETDSGSGRAAVSGVKRWLGISSPQSNNMAKIQNIMSQLTSRVERLGSQTSDADLIFYKQIAGDLADTSKTTDERKALLEQLVRHNAQTEARLMSELGTGGDDDTPPPPTAPGGGSTNRNNSGGTVKNNGGNMRYPGKPSGFQTFNSAEDGYDAAAGQVRYYQQKHGVNTLREVISRWSPPTENDTSRLIVQAANRTGFDPDTPLDLTDPVVNGKIMAAIYAQEGSTVPASRTLESGWRSQPSNAQPQQQPEQQSAQQPQQQSAQQPEQASITQEQFDQLSDSDKDAFVASLIGEPSIAARTGKGMVDAITNLPFIGEWIRKRSFTENPSAARQTKDTLAASLGNAAVQLPLAMVGGAGIGAVAKGLKYAAPTLSAMAGSGAAAAATADDEHRLEAGALGVLGEGAGRLLGSGVKAVLGGKSRAGQVIRGLIDEPVAVMREKLAAHAARTAPDGVRPTTGQMGDVGLSALEDTLAQLDNGLSRRYAQQEAGSRALADTLPSSEATIAERIAARKAGTQPLREAAMNAPAVEVDGEAMNVLSRIPRSILDNASATANVAGERFNYRPFVAGAEGQADEVGEIAARDVERIKKSIDDAISGSADSSVGKEQKAAYRKLKRDLLEWYGTKSTEYGEYTRAFSELSKPVDESKVLNYIADKRYPTQDSKASRRAFERATANRGGSTERAAKVFEGTLESMSAETKQTLKSLADGDRLMNNLSAGATVNSATARRLAMLGGLTDDSTVASVATSIANSMGRGHALAAVAGISKKRLVSELEKAMLDPEYAAKLLEDPTISQLIVHAAWNYVPRIAGKTLNAQLTKD